jgi:hypothetical protein
VARSQFLDLARRGGSEKRGRKKLPTSRARTQVLSTPRMQTGRLGSGPRMPGSQCAMLPARRKFLTPGARLEVRLQGGQKWAARVYLGRQERIEAYLAENCFLFLFFIILFFFYKFKTSTLKEIIFVANLLVSFICYFIVFFSFYSIYSK